MIHLKIIISEKEHMMYLLYSLLLSSNIIVISGKPLLGSDVETVSLNEFPFVVSIGLELYQILNKYAESHLCGGSLITRKHVLTSAHCIDEISPEFIKTRLVVIVGSNNLKYGKKYHIKKSTTYDQWFKNTCLPDDDNYHDIAILQLYSCVREEIEIAKITERLNSEFYGLDAVTVGWGEIEPDVNSLLLKKANLHILTHENCTKLIEDALKPEDVELWDRNLCTKANTSILLGCGDSGGPLIINGTEIIAINDSVCPGPERYPKILEEQRLNLHIGIGYYRNFIEDVTKEDARFC